MVKQPSSPLRILAFDPASGTMGWAVLEYDVKKKRTTVTHHGLVEGEKAAKELRKTMLAEFGRQYTTLCAIRDVLKSLITTVNPDYVTSEGPFAHRFVQAYASLKLVVDRIRQASHEILNQTTHEIQPTEVKADAAGSGTAKKEEVKAGLLAKKDLLFTASTRKSVKDASEHEIDAIGVGYAFIKRRLPALLEPPTAKK